MADNYTIKIQPPSAAWLDVTGYATADGLGSIVYAVEDDLMQFRTGDVTLTFIDKGGYFTSLFAGASPSNAWRLWIERDSVVYFQGPIYIPGGVRFDRNAATCEVTAFGLSKILESVSAESVTRSFGDMFASTTAGSKVVTLNYGTLTTGLMQRDIMKLSTSQASEEFEIWSVLSTTQLKARADLARTWNGVWLSCETPYYRDKTPAQLAALVYTAAGFSAPVIDVTGTSFVAPVAAPMSSDGIELRKPCSINEVNGKIRVRSGTPQNGAIHEEAESVGATVPFTLVADANMVGHSSRSPDPLAQPIVDWRTIRTTAPTYNVISQHQLLATSEHWHLAGVTYNASPVLRYGLYHSWVGNNHTYKFTWDPWNTGTKSWDTLFRTTVLIEGPIAGTGTFNAYSCMCSAAFDQARNLVYYCYEIPTDSNAKMGTWSPTGGTASVLNTGTGWRGYFQYAPEIDVMLMWLPWGYVRGFRNRTMLWERTAQYDGILPYAIRWCPSAARWVCIRQRFGKTSLVVADENWTKIQELPFSDTASSSYNVTTDTGLAAYNDFFNDANNILGRFGNVVVGRVNGDYVVIDNVYSGVVEYANMADKSCAQALAELAKLTNCVTLVDVSGKAYFVTRASSVVSGTPIDVTAKILTDSSMQIWEQWLGQVTVRNEGIAVTTPSPNAQGKTVDISCAFVPNQSVAAALGIAYQNYYGVPRQSREIAVHDDGTTFYKPLGQVIINDEYWVVYEAGYRLSDSEVDLRLVYA